jgi:hypothetical protein
VLLRGEEVQLAAGPDQAPVLVQPILQERQNVVFVIVVFAFSMSKDIPCTRFLGNCLEIGFKQEWV